VQSSGIIWRIDDRLIHGQVIIGWCGQLPVERLIVCDNEIASTEWEKNLLLMAAPTNLPAEVRPVEQTANSVHLWQSSKKITLILLRSPQTLKALLEKGIPIEKVNIGGIHYQEDRREFLPYLYLSNEEIEIFSQLIKTGIYFECQDLPTSNSYNLEKLIEKKYAGN
jgi:mannose/fructose/N-acetylgalactosamine-specific phosphotransferase system component IIB